MRLIDGEALRKAMYHEAFETDSDMQKWDSGCWIRYKMFEIAIESAPTIDAVPVVRCKDCQYSRKVYILPSAPLPNTIVCRRYHDLLFDSNHFCSQGERKDDE